MAEEGEAATRTLVVVEVTAITEEDLIEEEEEEDTTAVAETGSKALISSQSFTGTRIWLG